MGTDMMSKIGNALKTSKYFWKVVGVAALMALAAALVGCENEPFEMPDRPNCGQRPGKPENNDPRVFNYTFDIQSPAGADSVFSKLNLALAADQMFQMGKTDTIFQNINIKLPNDGKLNFNWFRSFLEFGHEIMVLDAKNMQNGGFVPAGVASAVSEQGLNQINVMENVTLEGELSEITVNRANMIWNEEYNKYAFQQMLDILTTRLKLDLNIKIADDSVLYLGNNDFHGSADERFGGYTPPFAPGKNQTFISITDKNIVWVALYAVNYQLFSMASGLNDQIPYLYNSKRMMLQIDADTLRMSLRDMAQYYEIYQAATKNVANASPYAYGDDVRALPEDFQLKFVPHVCVAVVAPTATEQADIQTGAIPPIYYDKIAKAKLVMGGNGTQVIDTVLPQGAAKAAKAFGSAKMERKKWQLAKAAAVDVKAL